MSILDKLFARKIEERAEILIGEQLEVKANELLSSELARISTTFRFKMYPYDTRTLNLNKLVDSALKAEFERQINTKEVGDIIIKHVKESTDKAITEYLNRQLNDELRVITGREDFIKSLVEELNTYQIN